MSVAASAVIRLDLFRQNLETIRRKLPPGTLLCPAVKANGYGHGLDLLLPILTETATDALAVAQLEEAVELRQLGWRRRVLCLGTPVIGESEHEGRERAGLAIASGFECTVSSHPEIELLSQAAMRLGQIARLHIKIDTGMGRMGVLTGQAAEFVLTASRMPAVSICGIYTHFATADEQDPAFARQQLNSLLELKETLRTAQIPPACYHAANSAAVFSIPGSGLDMARPGLAIYGCWGGHPDGRPPDLRPILRLVSRIVCVRQLPADHSIGYGRTFRTARNSVIGVVPVGYADGYRRALSNRGILTLEARRGSAAQHLPVVGRVSMDTVCVNLTGVADVRVGDPVALLDDRPEAPNSVESIARQIGTIPYEITCGIGPRVRRVAAKVDDLIRE